jgi:hypothetical protein
MIYVRSDVPPWRGRLRRASRNITLGVPSAIPARSNDRGNEAKVSNGPPSSEMIGLSLSRHNMIWAVVIQAPPLGLRGLRDLPRLKDIRKDGSKRAVTQADQIKREYYEEPVHV